MAPTVLPIDLTAIFGIVVGGLFVLIPVAGFTARFALKPIVEAIARMKENQVRNGDLGVLEQRVSLIEQHLQGIETRVERLAEKREFDRQIAAPGS